MIAAESRAPPLLNYDSYAPHQTLIPLPGATILEEKSPADVPAHPAERYLLPKKWRSGGMEFTEGGSRKSWEDFGSTQLPTSSQAAPLIFHLDDIVLGDTARKPVTIPKDSRITLYDHLLAVRQPDTATHRPQWWKDKVATNYLPGESAFGASGDHFEQTTRLVHWEGRFFDLREDRVTTGESVGARLGFENQHPFVHNPDGNPFLKMHDGGAAPVNRGLAHIRLIDVPFVNHRIGGKPVSLVHALIYMPCFPIPPAMADDATFYGTALPEAERRWSQLHPGVGPGRRKDLVLMPKSKSDVEPGLKVARFRLVVMPRRLPDGHVVSMNRIPATGAEALSFSPNRHAPLMVVSKDSLAPGPAQDDRDGTSHAGHAFSHELGHVLGCPDEYTAHQRNMTPEVSKTTSGFWPRVPRFSQQLGSHWDGGRPYHNDPHTAMVWNRAPRLRHYWHFVQLLNSIGGKSNVLLSEDYLLENRSWPDKLRYEPPAVSGAGIKSDAHVWEPIAQTRLGHAEALLYRLGEGGYPLWAQRDTHAASFTSAT